MDIAELVESLPHPIFNEMRKAVVERHTREASELVQLAKYLEDEDILGKAGVTHPMETLRVMAEKTGINIEVCHRALTRFLSIQEKKANGQIENPFKAKRKDG